MLNTPVVGLVKEVESATEFRRRRGPLKIKLHKRQGDPKQLYRLQPGYTLSRAAADHQPHLG